MNEDFKQNIMKAAIHCGYSIIYVLFILPFDLWKKAVARLAAQREAGALKISSIDGPWPYFTFCRILLTEFFFDFMAFISWFLAILIGCLAFLFFLYQAIDSSYNNGELFLSGIGAFIASLIGGYYIPITCAIGRDLVQLLLLPVRKIISWFRKPAQYLDLNIKK